MKRTEHGSADGIKLGLLLITLARQLLPQGFLVRLLGYALRLEDVLRLLSDLLAEVYLSTFVSKQLRRRR